MQAVGGKPAGKGRGYHAKNKMGFRIGYEDNVLYFGRDFEWQREMMLEFNI